MAIITLKHLLGEGGAPKYKYRFDCIVSLGARKGMGMDTAQQRFFASLSQNYLESKPFFLWIHFAVRHDISGSLPLQANTV